VEKTISYKVGTFSSVSNEKNSQNILHLFNWFL